VKKEGVEMIRYIYMSSIILHFVLKSVHYAPFLQRSVQLQVVLFIRLLCSFPTTVCAAADSVVDQVALLPSNNGLRYSEQYCVSGRYASFLH